MSIKNTPTSFSTATISALIAVVTGGTYDDPSPAGKYRSGPKLEQFLGDAGIDLQIGSSSRVSAVRDALIDVNKTNVDRSRITRAIEAVAHPGEYVKCPDVLEGVIEHMNVRLRFDGCELRMVGDIYRLVPIGTTPVAAAALSETAQILNLVSVQDDFERALQTVDDNPSSAITAACSTAESVCKCILDELKAPYPAKKDIKSLATEVARHINLSPGRKDLPAEWEQDIRRILSGLFNVMGGIGSLRTHAGDAHGKGKIKFPADARIARLAIHAASTVSLFYIETWQRMEKQDAAPETTPLHKRASMVPSNT